MKVAIVYDRINKWGGAERVLLVLHKIFPEAHLFTSLYDPKSAPWARVFPKITTSPLNNFTFLRRHHEYLAFFMPLIFESFNFEGFDLVISVTSEAAKGIKTSRKTKHICYCLTPTRYLWSHYETYFKNTLTRFIARPVISYLRWWDREAARRPDVMIAISSEVQKRIKKYYKRDSIIVHPPLMIKKKKFVKKPLVKFKNYYLLVSRLVPYKNVDLAIDVFNEIGENLVIVGTGSELSKLKKMAKNNIRFTGFVSDIKLSRLYKNANALIFPQEEDFGLVSIEAQSFGVAVIANKKAGALDTVTDGKTGIFFDTKKPGSLKKAVEKFTHTKFDKNVIIESTNRFSQTKFEKQFKEIIKNAWLRL